MTICEISTWISLLADRSDRVIEDFLADRAEEVAGYFSGFHELSFGNLI